MYKKNVIELGEDSNSRSRDFPAPLNLKSGFTSGWLSTQKLFSKQIHHRNDFFFAVCMH